MFIMKTAWIKEVLLGQVESTLEVPCFFVKMQCKLTKALKSTVDCGNCHFVGMLARAFHKDVEFLWHLVHSDAVKKCWITIDIDSEIKSTSHSTTLFRTLQEYSMGLSWSLPCFPLPTAGKQSKRFPSIETFWYFFYLSCWCNGCSGRHWKPCSPDQDVSCVAGKYAAAVSTY